MVSLSLRRLGGARAAARYACAAAAALAVWQVSVGALVALEAASGFAPSPALCLDPPGLHAEAEGAASGVAVTQLWRDGNVSDYPLGAERASAWRALCGGSGSGAGGGGGACAYALLTDADVDAQLRTPAYAWFREAYLALPAGVRRADAARLLAVHARGGVYADLDVSPAAAAGARRLLALVASGRFDCVLPLAGGGGGASNYVLACGAGSPFVTHALVRLRARVLVQGWWRRLPVLPYLDVLAQTGPVFLTGALRSYAAAAAAPGAAAVHACVALAPSSLVGSWVSHAAGRSWMGADGKLLLHLEDSGMLAAVIAPASLALAAAVVVAAIAVAALRRNRRSSLCCCCCCCWPDAPAAADDAALAHKA